MKFEENLRELRKQLGLSQEELAEKLEVSRQAVSKWENGSAYPEVDKLLLLCDIFHCKIDDLLQGNVKVEETVSKRVYEEHENSFAKAVTLGVGLIVFSMSLYCYLEPFFLGGKEGILHTMFMGVITIAVLIFVFFGMRNADFYKKHGKAPLHIYTESEVDEFEKTFRKSIVIGVAFILIGVIFYVFVEKTFGEAVANGTFMLLVSIAASIFVYYGLMKDKYEKTMKKSKQNMSEYEIEDKERMIGVWCGCIMMVAAIIYLIWSFGWNAWQISWLIFPIAGILCGIASMILYLGKRDY